MAAPVWCKQLAREAAVHMMTAGQAVEFDWSIHVDRLCSVTGYASEDTNVITVYIYYHCWPWQPDAATTHARCIQINSVDALELMPVYKLINEALARSKLNSICLNYPTFSTIWPYRHLRGIAITTDSFEMSSCRSRFWEATGAPDKKLTPERGFMVSKMIGAWALWREEQEYITEAGPKRKLEGDPQYASKKLMPPAGVEPATSGS